MTKDTRHFSEELDELKERLLTMGALARERLQMAIRGLVQRDGGLIDYVIGGDEAVNKFHVEIDDRCLKLLALHQPVAVDLRVIMAAVKINSDLERVGDLAVNIGDATKRYLSHPPVKPLLDLPRMGDIALKMLGEALDSFVTGDAKLAQSVLAQDDVLDGLKNQVFRELLTYMLGDPSMIAAGIDLILISRHLERVGDHATNIAEDVIFIVEARDVRHPSADVTH
jgi:phosphate transport system protein